MTLDQAIETGEAIYSHDTASGYEVFQTLCHNCGGFWSQQVSASYETECPPCTYAPAFNKVGGSHWKATSL